MSDSFAAEWLMLREPLDDMARHAGLATRFISALPRAPWIIDLGAGTGSQFRYLAPRIGGEQHWTLIDRDPALLDEAFNAIAEWAHGLGLGLEPNDSALVIRAPGGAWRVDGELHDLAEMPGELPLREADAVTCSALLDLVSRGWIDALAATLRQPFYATLSVDGREVWAPAHPADKLVRAGFARDQGRDKGFGRTLGPHAPAVAMAALRAHGFAVASAPSDWVVPRPAIGAAHALILDHADAARRALPAASARINAWETARHHQSMRNRLAIRVGHRDILALPKE